MIATRDRAAELCKTLELLRLQSYDPLELVIIDDGSRDPVEPLVRRVWPDAVIIRHRESRGQCERRNQGFAMAHGEFILQLDDDCSLIRPGDLARAIRYITAKPSAGALVFDLYNGPTLPDRLEPSSAAPGCVSSFVGAAVLLRSQALRPLCGYREFFLSHREEEELALQLLAAGWQILYWPEIVAHHRLSELNRNGIVSWQRGLCNEIWMLVLHIPTHRLPLEIAWKMTVGVLDALRLGRLAPFCSAIWRSLCGLKRAWRLRRPLSPLALRRYDALRFRGILSEDAFTDPPAIGWQDIRAWSSRWRNRARDASIWETGGKTKGSSNIARYAHEVAGRGKQP